MASTVDNADREARFLTVPEVATELGIPRVRCYELVASGAIPHVRLSARCIRVPRAWIEAQESAAMDTAAALFAPSTSEGPAGNGTSAKLAGAGDGRDGP